MSKRGKKRPLPASLFLAGFMGVGKSTVGRLLADRLAMPFVDTDREIERRSGKTISQLFSVYGERDFRKQETEVLEGVCQKNAVVALGGGALEVAENRQILLGRGFLIYLRATPSTLAERIGSSDNSRPLLEHKRGKPLSMKIEAMLALRTDNYTKSNHIIDTDNKSPHEVTEHILRVLER